MQENPTLVGTLPRIYNRDNIDQRRLGELVDLFNNARFSRQGEHRARDLMGEVYEYFLGAFARAEGKRGGEFFTPPSVVKVIVELLEPNHGRVYDPCCGSGGMFVQTEKFIHEHDGDPKDIAVFGQEGNEETWRLAKMNLAIHGIENKGLGARWGDTFARDQHADLQMDFVMANPPFNIKDWARNVEDPRWKYGVPPANNANYAWIQHILSKLAPGGKAGVVMANGSMSSNSNGEGDIRAQIVEADLVSCMVALPTQLFRSTGIPVCLWFFAKDKTKGKQGSIDRSGQVLFIDARELGYMVDRAERDLDDGGHQEDRRHLPRVAGDEVRDDRVRRRPGLLQVGDPRRDQGRRLRAHAGTVRRRGRVGGRRRSDRRQDRAAHEGAPRSLRRVGALRAVVRKQLERING